MVPRLARATWPPTPRTSCSQDSQLRQPVGSPVGRRAQPPAAGPRPGQAGQPAGAGRADQRPRHGDAGPAGGPAGRLRGHADPGQPRPRLHRPAGHLDHRPGRPRPRGGDAGRLAGLHARQNPGFFAAAARVDGGDAPAKAAPPARAGEAAPRPPSSPTRTSAGCRNWTPPSPPCPARSPRWRTRWPIRASALLVGGLRPVLADFGRRALLLVRPRKNWPGAGAPGGLEVVAEGSAVSCG